MSETVQKAFYNYDVVTVTVLFCYKESDYDIYIYIDNNCRVYVTFSVV